MSMFHSCLKILASINLGHIYSEVWEKAITLVIPDYISSSCNTEKQTAATTGSEVHNFLQNSLPQAILKEDCQDVSLFLLEKLP